MTNTLRFYEGDGVVVEYDPARCIHVEACVRGLPAVFDPTRRSWIAPGLATADAVAQVVRRRPTGALHYRRITGSQESPPAPTEVRPEPDGPLYVHSQLRIRLSAGETKVETRVALCRGGCERGDRPAGCAMPMRRVGDQAVLRWTPRGRRVQS